MLGKENLLTNVGAAYPPAINHLDDSLCGQGYA